MSRQVRTAADRYGYDKVLVTSFTRAAAAELAGRNLPIPASQVGTLHAHCYRALGHPPMVKKILSEWNAEHPEYDMATSGGDEVEDGVTERSGKGYGDEIAEAYGRLRSMLIPRDIWPDHITAFATAWERWKAETGTFDFTDLIEVALADLDTAPGRPDVAFVDEAQDLVPLQLALVRKWGRRMRYLVLCGDDDQCLYSWTGATPDAFLDPPIPPERKRVLDQSYRVPRTVHAAAQQWVEQLTRREPKLYRPRDAEGAVEYLPASWKSAEAIVDAALGYVDAGKRVMILASCDYMLRPTIAVLRRWGIPFHNPYRRNRGDWNPLHPGRGVSSAERLLSYLRPRVEVWGEDTREWNPEDLRRWTDVIEAKGVLKHGTKARLESLSSAEPLEWLAGIEPYFEMEAMLDAIDCDLGWFERHLKGSSESRMAFPIAVARERGGKTLREEPQICVGTIHSVKGGEADAVLLFPDLSPAGYEEWTSGPAGRDPIVRQFYVGMTRARETLVICDQAGPAVHGLAA